MAWGINRQKPELELLRNSRSLYANIRYYMTMLSTHDYKLLRPGGIRAILI